MKCINCGKEFDGRKDAKFCSTKCRKEAFLKRSINVPVGTDKRSKGKPCPPRSSKSIYPALP